MISGVQTHSSSSPLKFLFSYIHSPRRKSHRISVALSTYMIISFTEYHHELVLPTQWVEFMGRERRTSWVSLHCPQRMSHPHPHAHLPKEESKRKGMKGKALNVLEWFLLNTSRRLYGKIILLSLNIPKHWWWNETFYAEKNLPGQKMTTRTALELETMSSPACSLSSSFILMILTCWHVASDKHLHHIIRYHLLLSSYLKQLWP